MTTPSTAGIHSVLLKTYRRLPRAGRRLVLRAITPSYRVGSICVVERADSALLMVRPSYRRAGWGFPGGFLKRGESPADAVVRELEEELGVHVEVNDNPLVVVDPDFRRVDVIYNGTIVTQSSDEAIPVTPKSPELLDARWFLPSQLPVLLPEAARALVELGRANRPESES